MWRSRAMLTVCFNPFDWRKGEKWLSLVVENSILVELVVHGGIAHFLVVRVCVWWSYTSIYLMNTSIYCVCDLHAWWSYTSIYLMNTSIYCVCDLHGDLLLVFILWILVFICSYWISDEILYFHLKEIRKECVCVCVTCMVILWILVFICSYWISDEILYFHFKEIRKELNILYQI
jgi:hypothetical protein